MYTNMSASTHTEMDNVACEKTAGSQSKSNKRSCAVCQSVQNLRRCSRCKSVFYCCRDHQKTDWLQHKSVCALKSVSDSIGSVLETGGAHTDNDPMSSSVTSPPTVESSSNSVHAEAQRESGDVSAEIESILDFSSVTFTNVLDTNKEEESGNSKDIFSVLQNSDSENYMGPSDNIMPSENESIQTASVLQSISEENENASETMPEVNDRCIPDERISDETLQHAIAEGANRDAVSESLIPLDSRPLRKLKFPKPDSYDEEELAEFISLRLINLGYCILDDLFEEDHVDDIREELKDFTSKHKLTNHVPVNNNVTESTTTSVCNSGERWIKRNGEGLTFTSKALSTLDSIMNIINPHLREYSKIQGRTKALVAHDSGNGSFHRRQVDNPNKDGRRITCILYLDKDWDVTTNGGLLRIVKPHLDKPIDIPPKSNRLVFFWSDKRIPFEVHPVHRERLILKVWYYDVNEKEKAKSEKQKAKTEDEKVQELKSQTDQITARISELEEQRRQLEEAAIEQQLQNKAMEAVRSLPQEELEALSFLVYNHPNPQQVMTSMGISSTVQDALILHLGNLT